MPEHFLVIAGTNRPKSNARKVAEHLLRIYQSLNVSAELLDLHDLPVEIFSPSVYASKPESFLGWQRKVLEATALHVVTPEYNGSFPGILKYFIDMLKFPESFQDKPVAYVGEAAGQWGALRSVEQLQLIFGYRNAYSYPDRVFIPSVHTAFGPDGTLEDQQLVKRLEKQVGGFVAFTRGVGG